MDISDVLTSRSEVILEKLYMPAPIIPLDANKDDHDDLVFLDEQPAPPLAIAPRNVWRVMIIDDDEDVHSTTTFALGNLEMQHRPLEFVHAYSAGQARTAQA